MSDNPTELTRRKVLAGLGGIGAAGAAAGYGTTAMFTDFEKYEDNTLAAGELDLKIDWEEHYSFPQIYDEFSPPEPAGATRQKPSDANLGNFKAFPPGAEADDDSEPLLWIPRGSVGEYMDATAIEAFPDLDNDGTGEFTPDDGEGEEDGVFQAPMFPDRRPCDVLADVPKDFDDYTVISETDGDGNPTEWNNIGRTRNADTELDGEFAPLINLEDVKPGDFGEITFSTHLCNNPGYLWMQMPGGLQLEENGVTEPEADSTDEDQEESEPGNEGEGAVELADAVQGAIWYDNNCDNLVTDLGKLDVVALADISDSLSQEDIDDTVTAANAFLDALPANETVPGSSDPLVRGSLITFNSESEAEQDAGGIVLQEGLGPITQFYDGGSADVSDLFPTEDGGLGNTPTPHALDLAESLLDEQGRNDARQVILLVTDGLPNYNPNQTYEMGDPTDPFTQTEGAAPDEFDSATGTNDQGGCTELVETKRAADAVIDQGIGIIVAGIGVGDTSCDPDNPTEGTSDDIKDALDSDDETMGGIIGGDTFLQFDVASKPDNFNDVSGFNETELTNVAESIAQSLVGGQGNGDQIICTGSLRDLEDVLTGEATNSDEGLPLDGDRSTPFDEKADPDDDPDRDPFPAFTTACFGFSWWVPTDVGNEIQSDTARFDLGFYTEQARNNGGDGTPS